MSINHLKIYTKLPNGGYGNQQRGLALQKSRVKRRRQNSLHVNSSALKGLLTVVDLGGGGVDSHSL